MNRNQYSDEFREQALSKVRHRGTRSPLRQTSCRLIYLHRGTNP